MTTHCYIPMLGKRIRVTELDSCGVVTPGTSRYIVTSGFVTVTLSSEVEDGTEIIVRNAAGQLCVNEKMADSFKRFTVEIEFCGVNPSLLAMVTNAEAYLDAVGDVAGFTVPEGEIHKWFALELWTGLSGQACLPGQTGEASGYMLLPYVVAGVLGDIEISGEDAITFSLTNSYTRGGNSWGVGPYEVVYGGTRTNEVQTVTITGAPTGGTFTLDFGGRTTAGIAFDATAADVQEALEALVNIEPGDVTVTGGPFPGSAVTVTFGGRFAGVDVSLMTSDGTGLTGGTAPTVGVAATTPGDPGTPSALPTPLDPFDHLLMIDTAVSPPPVACSPAVVPSSN